MDNHNEHDYNNNSNLLLSDLFLWDNPSNNTLLSSNLMDEAYLFSESSSSTSSLFLNQQQQHQQQQNHHHQQQQYMHQQPNSTESSFFDLFSQEKDFIINEPSSSLLMLHQPHNNNGLIVEPFMDVAHTIKPQSGKRKKSLEDNVQEITKKPRKRKRKKVVDPNAPPKLKRITGLNKPLLLSTSLQIIMDGATQLSRPEIVKRLWTYIKTNQLQDPADRRFILCDEKLKTIFQKDRVNSFGMNRDLSAHLTKIEFTAMPDTTITSPPSSVVPSSLVIEDFSPVPTAETPDIMTPSDTEMLQKWNSTTSSF